MKLFEYEGKELFKAYGIPVSNGWLWDDCPSELSFPVIAKAQVLTGGRGKAGGIITIPNHNAFESIVNRIRNLEIKGERVSHIYIEEIANYQKEFYLSIIIDRNQKCPVILASADGGVDIEEVEAEKILSVSIHPLLGLQPYMIRRVAQFLKMDLVKIQPLLTSLWNMFVQEHATLVEINPLFLLETGELCAGDAKVIIDDHAEQDHHAALLPRMKDGFEAKCLELGAVGVDLDGDIAVITSGAGLGMATFDLVSHNQGTVRTLVDLGGHVIHDISSAETLIQHIKELRPKAFLFNFYFQVASCNVLATAIAKVLGNTDFPVVVRLKGKDEDLALLSMSHFQNIYTTDKLVDACQKVVEKAGGFVHGNHC
ncbi:ATP-grasp domain-containing protein [Ammoniphilus sp. 3BR4]|uniref:ATP-grasp domain-containing protein n=1 Tax=Ammoniphilus sp. 3BR4 TaxID=3158265 RepID=UPI0034663150